MSRVSEIKAEEQLTLHRALREYEFSDVEEMAAVFSLTKTPLAIGRADSGTLDLVNPAFAELYGCSVDELSGTPIADIFAPEVRERAMERLDKAYELGHTVYESIHMRKDGSLFPVQIEITAVRDEERNLQFRIVTVLDITERKADEGKINALMEELRRSNRDLEEFTAVLAHDLKSPLVAIAGFSRHLAKKYSPCLDERGRNYVSLIGEGAERMLRLISELREYAKSGAGPREFTTVDMDGVIRQAMENLRGEIEANGVEIRVERLPSVVGDEIQLVQLAQNLLGNSIRYRKTDEQLTVGISYERHGNEWVFRLKDNGIGIEQSLFEKIFVTFQRGRPGRHEGLGLGLSICKKIVEQHGGRIWVNARPGKGTTFYFSLPVRE